MPDECCELTFVRWAKGAAALPISPLQVPAGRDLWVSEQSVEVDGECKQLVGVFFDPDQADPGVLLDHINICNCAAPCWIVGERFTDPETGLDKFKGRWFAGCCQCLAAFYIEPCCPVATPPISITEDCAGRATYDVCNALVAAVCYRRGTRVTAQFPAAINCGGQVLSFDHATIEYCAHPETTETVGGPSVSFAMPVIADDSPCSPDDPCQVEVTAYYAAPCCQCQLTVEATANGMTASVPVTITPDCDGLGNGSTTLVRCYASGFAGSMTVPDSITLGGNVYRHAWTVVSSCRSLAETRYAGKPTGFTMPSAGSDGCPQGGCWAKIRLEYIWNQTIRCGDLTAAVSVELGSGATVPVGGPCGGRTPLCTSCPQMLADFKDVMASQGGILMPGAGAFCSCNFGMSQRNDLGVCHVEPTGEGTCEFRVYSVCEIVFGWDFSWNSLTRVAWVKAHAQAYGHLEAAAQGVGCHLVPGWPEFCDSPRCLLPDSFFGDADLMSGLCLPRNLGLFNTLEAAVNAAVAAVNVGNWAGKSNGVIGSLTLSVT